jgi:hypothetical protein
MPPEVETTIGFELGIHCQGCGWSMPLDELRDKHGRIVRKLSELGLTLMDVETPEPACPRCGGQAFKLRFAI